MLLSQTQQPLKRFFIHFFWVYVSFLPALCLPPVLTLDLLLFLGFANSNGEVLSFTCLNQRWTLFRAMLKFRETALTPWCLAYSTIRYFWPETYCRRTSLVCSLAGLLLFSCSHSLEGGCRWRLVELWAKSARWLAVTAFRGRPTALFGQGGTANENRGNFLAALMRYM